METMETSDRDARVLLPQHEALIWASRISSEVATARGYWSVTKKREVADLGFGRNQQLVPALILPVWNVLGERATYQTRPDRPRVKDGKPRKYETPARTRMMLDVPPPAREQLPDPSVPLFITEGVRKADAGVSAGLCCVALLGVWNWRGTNEFGGTTALPDWEQIALNERQVYICFDSDVMTKPHVHGALARLKAFLEQRGAQVGVIYLPPGPAGEKVGLDDYLAADHNVADLLSHGSAGLRQVEGEGDGSGARLYRETPHGLVRMKPTLDGEAEVPLTNFTARVVGEVIRDDGAETERRLEVEANLRGRVTRCSITAQELSGMGWPLEHLGAGAVVYAGMGTRDHARAAIQLLSGEMTVRRVYVHTGWREIDGQWLYLHAGGAIGSAGVNESISVELPEGLSRFRLPSPPRGERLREAVRASLDILDLAPDVVTVPLFCAIWRAAMGGGDFSLHLAGATGAGKSELAALAQQHWGPELTARNLPGNWSSTENALEAMAFGAKDALFVVDDFAPGGTASDVSRLHREADRLLRAQGNRSGRQRMRADTSLRPAKPPRGLILSTGEDVPKGQSLGARLLVLDMSTEMMDWEALTHCQAAAVRGDLAAAMAAFLQWLADRYGDLTRSLPAEVCELRTAATGSAMHKRTPEIVANLALGSRYFLAFAEDAGVLSAEETAALWRRGWKALGQAASIHSSHQVAAEPAGLFLRLLGSAIASGRAHVAGADGAQPSDPRAWGWRRNHDGWQPQGGLVGWVSGDELYLESDAAFAVARSHGEATGDGLAITQRTMHKRLAERQALASTDATRKTHTVRRVLAGTRRDVLHLRAQSLLPRLGTDQTDQTDDRGREQPEDMPDGQFPGQFPALQLSETDHTNCPEETPGNGKATGVVGLGSLGSPAEGEHVPPCYTCGGIRFWRDRYGSLTCNTCHPPADESVVTAWVSGDGSEAESSAALCQAGSPTHQPG